MEKFLNKPLKTRQNRPLTRLEKVILQLYGQGLGRAEIARLVAAHMHPEWRHNRPRQLKATRQKLMSMEQSQWFRDALYNMAVVKTDLSIPEILDGVVKKAKRGRVDAAKLALAVTGRQVDTDGSVNVPIQINFRGEIPRPYGQEVGGGIAGQHEAQEDEEVEDAEWEEVDE